MFCLFISRDKKYLTIQDHFNIVKYVQTNVIDIAHLHLFFTML